MAKSISQESLWNNAAKKYHRNKRLFLKKKNDSRKHILAGL